MSELRYVTLQCCGILRYVTISITMNGLSPRANVQISTHCSTTTNSKKIHTEELFPSLIGLTTFPQTYKTSLLIYSLSERIDNDFSVIAGNLCWRPSAHILHTRTSTSYISWTAFSILNMESLLHTTITAIFSLSGMYMR